MSLARQLSEFYHLYDPIHKVENFDQSEEIFSTLIGKNRIIHYQDSDENVIGFVESWRIDYQQFGWLLCHPEYPSNLNVWDLNKGNICYLANVIIHPDYRFSHVYQYLKTEFFRQNYACDFFVGQAYRKRHQPLKIFTRQEFYDRYAKEESKEGVMHHG